MSTAPTSHRPHTLPAVLSIAGSDSSGGAGIQADIKTVSALGLFAETAITAITAQNTRGVWFTQDIEPKMVAAQIDAVFDDIPSAAVKIGMVSQAATVSAIADHLERWEAANIVVDPVMVATSGSTLISDEAIDALGRELFTLARLITPNIPEAEVLSGRSIQSERDQESVAEELAERHSCAVLIKGGHHVRDANDVLVDPDDPQEAFKPRWFRHERVSNPNTHGTGCTLSSAIACGLAQGLPLAQAIEDAKAYLTGALEAQLDLGGGAGPIDHFWQSR